MPSIDLSFTKSDLAFAKIVSIPTQSLYSFAYNAGNLFAVMSLARNGVQNETLDSLNILGKKVVDTLEEEFFTLEVKDLDSIKQAISKTQKCVLSHITFSLAAAYFIYHQDNNILYLFTVGLGKTLIKRERKLATVSPAYETNPTAIISFSGVVENDDLIILETKQFQEAVNSKVLSACLDSLSPTEIAETLSPLVNAKENGGAAALIIKVTKPSLDRAEATNTSQEKKEALFFKNFLHVKFNHAKKIFLTVAAAILITFISSVFFAIQKQNDTKVAAVFEGIYPQAVKKYEEGSSLLPLNKNAARESFMISKRILEEGKSKFSKNSKEQKQIEELLKKVNEALIASSGINLIQPTLTDSKASPLLLLEMQSQNAHFTQDDKNIYSVDNRAVYSVAKGKEKTNQIIKNDNLWQEPKGLGTYLSNIYILDKKTILKFIPTQDGFTKTNYLQEGISLDFSNASSMTIDGSIFILFKDGNIQKFTRGKPESFRISGLDKAFINPSRIFTDALTNNIYTLDNGNSRIVVLNKDGVYQTQYQADILKNAKDFEVLEKDKKIYALSESKVYEIELK